MARTNIVDNCPSYRERNGSFFNNGHINLEFYVKLDIWVKKPAYVLGIKGYFSIGGRTMLIFLFGARLIIATG